MLSIPKESEPKVAFIDVKTSNDLLKASNSAYYLTGSTSSNCSKIIVKSSNRKTGSYDEYQLREYSYGNTNFRYGLREDWNNLYEGEMDYEFTAYCDGNQVKTSKVSFTYTKPKYQYPSYTNYSADPYNSNYYINSDGQKIQSPTYYPSEPLGASALCNDGTYSFSQSRRGTCSHHGGVSNWR